MAVDEKDLFCFIKWDGSLLESASIRYLTIIPRTCVRYEMVDDQRGTQSRVGDVVVKN